MKLIYFPKAYIAKPTDGKSVYCSKKYYRTTVNNLKDVVDIYNHGYPFRLESKEDITRLIILDLDDCKEGTKEGICQWIDKNNLNHKYYCNYSASMKSTKCKVFCWLDKEYAADSDEYKELYEKEWNYIKDNNQYYLDVCEYDYHQRNNAVQLTYGLPRNESFVNSIFNGLPIKEEDIEDTWITKKLQVVQEMYRAYDLKEEFKYDKEELTDDYFNIPVNKKEMLEFLITWKPNIFTETTGYSQQLCSVWHSFCYKNGKLSIIHYPDGSRHKAIEHTLIPHIVTNAAILNLYYNQHVTVRDCMGTISKWIRFTFEDGKEWLDNSKYKKYQDYVIDAYVKLLSNVDWKYYTDDMDKKEYIATNSDIFPQFIHNYKPRNKDRMKLLKLFRETCLDKLDDFTFSNYRDLYNTISYRTNCYDGDLLHELTMKLISKLKKNSSLFQFFGRCDKGMKHNMSKVRSDKGLKHASIHDCCKGMNKEQFDNYCKENKLSRYIKCKLRRRYSIVR